jgi:hypothetical protein
MKNSLAKVQPLQLIAKAKNIVESVGPYLISRWDSSSEALERHQLRMANVEALKTFLIKDVKSISAMRDSLRKKYPDASPEERIRLRRDIDDSDRDVRQLLTAVKALEYLPQFVSSSNECEDIRQEEGTQARITEHWMDKFNLLARSKNEEWRQDLLSRALAAEAANPGSVSLRALWLIGTLEEDKFQAFAALLDVSSIISGSFMIPGFNVISLKIPSCDLGQDIMIGALTYQLNDTGLLADFSSQQQIGEGQRLRLGYDRLDYTIVCKNELLIPGLLPSTIGNSIAIFYERNANLFGQQLLNDWLASLDAKSYEVAKQYPENDGLTIKCTEAEPVD